jgi:hypothetical protein
MESAVASWSIVSDIFIAIFLLVGSSQTAVVKDAIHQLGVAMEVFAQALGVRMIVGLAQFKVILAFALGSFVPNIKVKRPDVWGFIDGADLDFQGASQKQMIRHFVFV